MPELPEVETVKNGLLAKIKNYQIENVQVRYEGIIAYPQVNEFISKIKNEHINNIQRKGKFLIFELDNYYLLSHLRMEGKYFIKEEDAPLSKHDHIIFNFYNKKELIYNDTRKFGKMHLLSKEELYSNVSPLKDLGPDPWDKELTPEYLKAKLRKNKAIKTLLLDQSIIAGIGNIYADEILFMSKINPSTIGLNLTIKNCQDIISNTQKILEKSITLGGTTIHTYKSVNGVTGRFQQELLVHGKSNQECPICQNIIIKTTVNGRGTYYCPNCQK